MTRSVSTASDTGSVQRIYRRSDIETVTGYCIDHIYDLVKAGLFPKPIPLGPRAVGWLEGEIAQWQAERIAERDAREAA